MYFNSPKTIWHIATGATNTSSALLYNSHLNMQESKVESSQNKFEIVWTFIKTVATVRKSRDLLLLLNSGHVELTDSQLDNNIEAKRLYDGIPKSGNYDLRKV